LYQDSGASYLAVEVAKVQRVGLGRRNTLKQAVRVNICGRRGRGALPRYHRPIALAELSGLKVGVRGRSAKLVACSKWPAA